MLRKTILITGSKGLIGSALRECLTKLGFVVKGLDLAYPLNHPEHGDIQDMPFFSHLAADCSGIIHLAGVSRVITAQQDPDRCWRMNVEGTQKILEMAYQAKHKPWVLYASSREVYGQQDTLPVSETVALLPLNVYARSKVAAEQSVETYRAKGLQTAVLRFSNVYGSIHDHADRVIPAFCRAAALGGTIRIDGSDNIFDFSHVDDVVKGIIAVIHALQKGSYDLPSMHLTTGRGTTLAEAATLAKQCSKQALSFLEAPSRSFDVHTFYGDPSLAARVLGWSAAITLEQGMAGLIKAFEDVLEPQVMTENSRVA
ncbi:MAG: NAD(P)-dependent oxidoreductase [Gammaproteobacteria bacterium]|nr:NAD(P)-dependent oxidoreductase [Gammaproteobacteria bacterium]